MKPSNLVEKIWKVAIKAREKAYAPYSNFKVGAAFIVQADREIISGCNIENASYGATLCAERVAIFKALSEKKKIKIDDLVVVADTPSPTPPCGLCLQVMSEFCSPKLRIWLATPKKIFKMVSLRDLLPTPFKKSSL